MAFDDILKAVKKAADKDPHTRVYEAGDITMGSHIPFGVPSGIPRLDLRLGKPGLPAGKVIEYFGFERSGKTTAALHAVAQVQRMGGGGIFIDTEHSFNRDRALEIGVDPDNNFSVLECDTIEAIFRTLDTFIQSKLSGEDDTPLLIMVDSVTAVTSETEMKKKYGEVQRVGEDARVLRYNTRKIMKDIAASNVIVIFINHAVSTISANKYAKQSTSAGGHALKFFAALRCEFKNSGNLTTADKSERRGQKINIAIEKSKIGDVPKPLINDVVLFGTNGFDLATELLEAGKESGWLKGPNQQTYTLRLPDTEPVDFKAKDWPWIIEQHGNAHKMYRLWREWCKENGKITSWASKYGG
jgi:recombination protein RecA